LAAGVLWEALGAPAADIALANDVHSSLRQVYLGNRYYDHHSPGMDAKKLVRADRKCSSISLHGPLLCVPALAPLRPAIMSSRISKLLAGRTT